ncbi:MAG: hypothetical protein GX119_09925 [Syntrophomonadaceae bacterium]|jgi:hypothetical protein|nr:hypothetical protein [Syntrophomonadaceae bacterium]
MFEKGEKVLVPRTSGEKTVGTVIGFTAKGVVVEFPIGTTYQGFQHDYNPEELGVKIVNAERLIKIPTC